MAQTATLTADVLRQLADVVEGKRDLKDVISSVASNDSEIQKLQSSFDSFKNVISSLKRNIKESVKDEIRTNDLNAKYETSAALEVKDKDGNVIGHIGLQAKQKKSWWEKFKENMATSFQNRADLLTGKKTLKQVINEDASRFKQNLMEESVVFRKSASVADGVHKGIQKTISELRGTAKPNFGSKSIIEETNNRVKEKLDMHSSNKYASLDNMQFAVALGAAYDNFARLEHFNTPDNVKNEVLGEIGLVLEEAQKRFPNAVPEPNKGSYYKDNDVALAEQNLMPYMREAAKTNPLLQADVHRFESWRNGQDATVMEGSLSVKEMPFENFARFGHQGKTFTPAEGPFGEKPTDYFNNPYEKGNNIMSAKQLAEQKSLVDKLHIR